MFLRSSLILITILLAACVPSAPEAATPTSAPPSATASETATPAATGTATPTPSETPTPSVTPTYTTFRGKVIVDGRLSCRFGPGPDYLFKFTFGSRAGVEILGRMEYNEWVLVRTVGGTNRCWVNSDFLEMAGDIDALPPTDPHIVIAWSPYYGALSGVGASRSGDTVTVSWNGIRLRAGDDSEQVPYIVEAWVCLGGEPVFVAPGTYSNSLQIVDEGSCSIQPHARVAAAEKHGYTPFVDVAWPPAATPEP